MRFVMIAAVFVGLSMICRPGLAETPPIRFGGLTMGTTYEIRLPRLPDSFSQEAVKIDVERLLARLEALLSTYRPDSEISRFNRARTTEWFPVSPETRRVVAEALRIADLSAGAFDVSAAPLIELWGFGAAASTRLLPDEKAIDAALSHVGSSLIRTRKQPAALRKLDERMRIDLSAVAKGFAVDTLAEHFLMQGIDDFLVEIGGEIRGAGRSRSGEPWSVAIENPRGDPSQVPAIVALADASVATSGDYRNFFHIEGRRFSHVIDPRTGWPIAHRLVSVAVIDSSAMRADSLATALLVLGPEQGPRLAARVGIAALFMESDTTGIRHESTPEFERYISREEKAP